MLLMMSWMDEVGEIAPAITGFMAQTDRKVDVVAVVSDEPRKGNFSRFLDSLPVDKLITFHDVTNELVRVCLLKRGFKPDFAHSEYLNKHCENFIREPDDFESLKEIGARDVEIRFDSFTFGDLPGAEQVALQKSFEASPIVSSARINLKPRDRELDEEFLKKHGRPRPRGGLHGGLGESVYIYIGGAALLLSKKVLEKMGEELTKRAFEWLDARYGRKKETGLAEVVIYGPVGKQINTQAIVYDGRLRRGK
jgi:hypothetical protein